MKQLFLRSPVHLHIQTLSLDEDEDDIRISNHDLWNLCIGKISKDISNCYLVVSGAGIVLFEHQPHEILHIRNNSTIDLRLQIVGGGTNGSKQTVQNNNNNAIPNTRKTEKVIINQHVDQSLPQSVKDRIVFNPDTEPMSTTCYHVPIHEFKDSKWVVVDKALFENKTKIEIEYLNIVSFNVWFDYFEREARMLEILKICSEFNADIICLQEMTKGSLEIMTAQPFIRENYYISDSIEYGAETVFPYGVCIFVKKHLPINRMFLNELPTKMSRSCLSVEMTINGKVSCFSTIHLESLNSQPLRAKQMYLISTYLKSYDTALLCGDFNFDSERNYNLSSTPLENENIENFYPGFIDIWKELKYSLNDLGKTFPGDGSRYDRMIMKSSLLQPDDIVILGSKPFKDCMGKQVYPSDHFGLFCRLKIKEP